MKREIGKKGRMQGKEDTGIVWFRKGDEREKGKES